MQNTAKPSAELALKTLPRPLYDAITRIFAASLQDVALVGGTALAGFYAGHRRSDDIDLFVKTDEAKKAAVLAVESLRSIGATIDVQTHSAHYYRAICEWNSHRFTADVVLDPNLFAVGRFQKTGSMVIADMDTLLKMKIATLVSRCSEKDLYDLIWLFERQTELDIKTLLTQGQQIDAGVSVESLLISLSGSILKRESCDFGINRSASEIYGQVNNFRKNMILTLREYDLKQTDAPLKQALKMK